jgi:hypothetical protein
MGFRERGLCCAHSEGLVGNGVLHTSDTQEMSIKIRAAQGTLRHLGYS